MVDTKTVYVDNNDEAVGGTGIEVVMTAMKQITYKQWISIGAGATITSALALGTVGLANALFMFALDTKPSWSMPNRALDTDGPQPDAEDTDDIAESERWFDSVKQPVTLRSHDGLKLHGWLLDPDCSSPTEHLYAICCHGYTGEPRELAKWAHHYAKLGFTVLLPAQRAHELSEGRYIGMGLLESDDLMGWISLIIASDPKAHILLHGNSMGAATVMMTAGDARLPRNVIAAIEDCGYGSVAGQFTDTAAAMFHLPRPMAALLVKVASRVSKRKAGYRFEDASCTQALQHTTIPMMFIHGGADTFVSPKYLDMNYNACASINREKLLIPGADHTMSASTDPERYWRRVTGFVKRTFNL